MRKPGRGLITERTIRDAARSDRPIVLGDDTLITPSARDLARQLGVPLGGTVEEPQGEEPMDRSVQRVTIGSDHGGFELKESLKPLLTELGINVTDVGCNSTDPVDYPVFAARVADLVSTSEADLGIMIDGAGIGSAMVGNKIRGVRAASCHDVTSARNAREHNDANLLTLGGGLIGKRLAAEIVRTFLATGFAGGRHVPRVAMINALDH